MINLILEQWYLFWQLYINLIIYKLLFFIITYNKKNMFLYKQSIVSLI